MAEDLDAIQRCLFKELKQKSKFLDIGCGTGNLVLLAHYFGYEAAGLEYKLKTYRAARLLCNACYVDVGIEIIKGDMKTFKHYSEYDVLYYYQPMSNGNAMIEFSIRLAKEMKSDAYVISIGSDHGFEQSEKFEQIPGKCDIWRKK